MNGSHPTTYNRSGASRQWRNGLRAFALAALPALALAGCSAVSIPIGDAAGTSDVHAPLDLTGSLGDTAPLDIAPGDRREIAAIFPAAIGAGQGAAPLSWTNPETGNRGTITEIVLADPKGTQGCARFVTSANTFEGLRNYTGVACPDAAERWHVTALERATN